MDNFIGKYVQVYPGDSDSKYGTIVHLDNNGIVVQIDGNRSRDFTWKNRDGKLMFISYSARLSFVEVEQ